MKIVLRCCWSVSFCNCGFSVYHINGGPQSCVFTHVYYMLFFPIFPQFIVILMCSNWEGYRVIVKISEMGNVMLTWFHFEGLEQTDGTNLVWRLHFQSSVHYLIVCLCMCTLLSDFSAVFLPSVLNTLISTYIMLRTSEEWK